MKIRTGFVSNSSSSSFLVVFPDKPTAAEEVEKMLFEGDEGDTVSYYSYSAKKSEIAKTVFSDIKDLDEEEALYIFEDLCDLWPWSYNKNVTKYKRDLESTFASHSLLNKLDKGKVEKYIDLAVKTFEADINYTASSRENNASLRVIYYNLMDKKSDFRKELAKDLLEIFKEKHKGSFITDFCYSDNDGGFYTVMEHGGIFSNLPHITKSNH